MATYMEILKYVKQTYGFVPMTSWIAEVKEKNGLMPKKAHNRKNYKKRLKECPPDKIKPIEEALRHFGMLK